MTAMNRLLCLALIPLLAGGCQSASPVVPVPDVAQVGPPEAPGETVYLLGPGDQLEIIVHTAPELSRIVTIAPDGEIRIPYSGPIQTSGQTLEAVQQLLRNALASELRDPDIDVLLSATATTECARCQSGEVADDR